MRRHCGGWSSDFSFSPIEIIFSPASEKVSEQRFKRFLLVWLRMESGFFLLLLLLPSGIIAGLIEFLQLHSILIEELQRLLKPRCCWTATYIFVVGGGTRIQPDGRERFKKTISCLKPNQRFTLCPRRITWPCPTTQWSVQFSMGKTLFRSSSPSREFR